MNIQFSPLSMKFNEYFTSNNNPQQNKTSPYKYSNLMPLQQDCVTFCAKKKKKNVETDEIENSKKKELDDEEKQQNKVAFDLACDIHEECKEPLQKLLLVLTTGLKGLVESDTHPNNPIARGSIGIHGRPKSPESIMDKVPPRQLRKKQEIFKMGDLIGARIVLRSTSQQDFDLVFKELGKLVRSGRLNILEVENYRLTPKDSYISAKTLENFEMDCLKAGQKPKISSEPKDSGYTAVHLTVELPDGKYGEIQIMGRDMERIKDLEDFYYKKRCGKRFPKKYQPIRDMMDRVMGKTKKLENLDAFQIETLDRYIKDSYIHAKQHPARSSKKRDGKDYFLPIPYSLPKELGFENIAKLKEACESTKTSTTYEELTSTETKPLVDKKAKKKKSSKNSTKLQTEEKNTTKTTKTKGKNPEQE